MMLYTSTWASSTTLVVDSNGTWYYSSTVLGRAFFES